MSITSISFNRTCSSSSFDIFCDAISFFFIDYLDFFTPFFCFEFSMSMNFWHNSDRERLISSSNIAHFPVLCCFLAWTTSFTALYSWEMITSSVESISFILVNDLIYHRTGVLIDFWVAKWSLRVSFMKYRISNATNEFEMFILSNVIDDCFKIDDVEDIQIDINT